MAPRQRTLTELATVDEDDKPSPALVAKLEVEAKELAASPEGLRGPVVRARADVPPGVAREPDGTVVSPVCVHGRPRASCMEHPRAMSRVLSTGEWAVWAGGIIVQRFGRGELEKRKATVAAEAWRPAEKPERPARL